MNNKVFFLSILVFIMHCAVMQKASAQIEDIYYPHPNYMNYYLSEPIRDVDFFLHGMGIISSDTVAHSHSHTHYYTRVSSYNDALPIRVDSCMIYGIAACLTHLKWSLYDPDWALAPYYSGFGLDVELKASIFEATAGDSLVRLVKKQIFSLKKGQYPDKVLHLSDTGGARASVYEFYFDTPVMVRGSILVGLHTNDEKNIYGFCINLEPSNICAPGYDARVWDDSILSDWSAICHHHFSGMDSVPDVIDMGLEEGVIPCFNPIIRLQNGSVDEAGEAEDGVEVNPNPSRGRAEIYSVKAIRSVEVCDMSGRVVIRKRMGGGQHSVELTERLPQGCYVVRVETEQGTAVKKLVVE